MCIAILKPSQEILTKRVLKACFNNNPHGAGFAIASKKANSVIIRKGFFSFRKFWHCYREYQKRGETMIIHFRVATSGKIDGDNCHPWRVDKEHALIHNGNLEHKLGIKDDAVSDTGLFVRHILQPIFTHDPGMWQNDAFKWMVEETIGSGNKLVMINASGEYVIFHEKQGEWDNGCWFSNKTFKEERKKKAATNYTYIPAANKYGLTVDTQSQQQGQQQQLMLPAPPPKDIVPHSIDAANAMSQVMGLANSSVHTAGMTEVKSTLPQKTEKKMLDLSRLF